MRNSTRFGLLAVLCGLPGVTFAKQCADIHDDAERLACYDAEHRAARHVTEAPPTAPPAPAVVETPPPTEAPPPTKAPPAKAPPDSEAAVPAEAPAEFGKREVPERPPEFIEASIEKVVEAGGLDYLTLDNGQVWREIQDSHLRFRKGGKVTISEGVLNSYDLQLEGYNKITKVKRVR
jgi:hypothetical protein